MVLVHDDDLRKIARIESDTETVSGYLIIRSIVYRAGSHWIPPNQTRR